MKARGIRMKRLIMILFLVLLAVIWTGCALSEEVGAGKEHPCIHIVTEEGQPAREALGVLRKEHDGEEMVLKEMSVRYTDGTVHRIEAENPLVTQHAENLRTILHGLLRREVSLV